MDDNYIPEEEYQQRLYEVRERDPNLYEYIMWGNNPNEPFDYDAMEVRLLMAIKEQEEEQKQSVGDLSKMTAMEIVERILTQYGMGQEVYISGKEMADAMRYNPAKITMSGAAVYERKEIAPGKFVNVVKARPFSPAWYTADESVSGDDTVVKKEPSSGVDGHVFTVDCKELETARDENELRYEYELRQTRKPLESAIDWNKLVTARDEDELQQQMESAIEWKKLEASREDMEYQEQAEELARKIATVYDVPQKMLGTINTNMIASLKVVAETQRQEIAIEAVVGHEEFESHRDELLKHANTYAARCLYTGGHREYYEMVYRLCAEGYSLEQAIYGYKKRVGE